MVRKQMQKLGFVLYIGQGAWLVSQATAVTTMGRRHRRQPCVAEHSAAE
jgi:hypothetical protein